MLGRRLTSVFFHKQIEFAYTNTPRDSALTPEELLKNNVEWSSKIKADDPEYFPTLAKQQAPEFLWIGCSDSRVPANQITGLLPGEIFVHRNIANVVVHTDINCQSVLNFAVDHLKVKHVIVCGHYGCGGVKASMESNQLGIIDHWLRNIRDVYHKHADEFNNLPDGPDKVNRLCELNVIEQVAHVTQTNVIQNAWRRGQDLSVHGWIYGLSDGLLKKLTEPVVGLDQIAEQYKLDPR